MFKAFLFSVIKRAAERIDEGVENIVVASAFTSAFVFCAVIYPMIGSVRFVAVIRQ